MEWWTDIHPVLRGGIIFIWCILAVALAMGIMVDIIERVKRRDTWK